MDSFFVTKFKVDKWQKVSKSWDAAERNAMEGFEFEQPDAVNAEDVRFI